jgi:hypothetical protein
MLSPKQLQREAQMIARRMVRQKAWIEKSTQELTGNCQWQIINGRTQTRSRAGKVSDDLVSAMIGENWLRKDPAGSWRLTMLALEKFVPDARPGDFAAGHQLRSKKNICDSRGVTIPVIANETENPLGWMRARKDKNGKPMLDDFQFEAGEHLRRDFTIAGMSARTTANWDFCDAGSSKKGARGMGAIEISDRALAARQRLFSALDMLGPEMAGIVYDVCCLASGLETAERRLGWPRRSGKLVLQIALTKLSQHYGIARNPDTLQHRSLIGHWGKDGFRPHIPKAVPKNQPDG